MMRCHRLVVGCVVVASLVFASLAVDSALAAVSYTTPGSSYTQNFDTLPNSPTNVSLGDSPAGWTDDNASPGSNISLLGWYLYHPIDVSSGEGGFNGHQRLRASSGNSTTGSFYSFGTNATTDRALGSLVSTTLAANGDSMLMGLRLTNNTGVTLNTFTLTYNGEQWRDQIATPDNPKSLSFSYRTDATADEFKSPPTFVPAAALNFTAPVNAGTAAVNGNVAGRVNGITATISHLGWEPGTDLFLRWADIGVGGADDGIGIDDISFSAAVGTASDVPIESDTSAPANTATTWNNDQAPQAGFSYRVRSGDTVTVDSPFTGSELMVKSGGTVNISASGTHVPLLTVNAGGSLSESVNGDFVLGDATSSLYVKGNVTFNSFEPGSKFTLASDVAGSGDLNFNSNGAGSELILNRAGNHQGMIRFNGTGDTVRLQGPEGFGTIEMNSTGANTISYEPATGSLGGSKLIFNQPGKLVHAATGDRLQGGLLSVVANAAVTVDLTNSFTDERRMLIADELGNTTGHLEGSANVTVNGTVSAPAGGNVTRNEFEIGGTSPEPASEVTDPYSGTMTLNDYVNVEVRHNLPNAKIVVNNNAILDMGHQVIAATQSIKIGAVEVNNGGTLEVGFEQSSATVNGHHAYHLTLTGDGSRNGDLTLHDGATTVMQINGPASNPNQFDRITAAGSVTLDGTLTVLVNPAASTGTNPTYGAVIGDVFDIISTSAGALAGDYNHNGSVGLDDYNLWRTTYGSTVTAGTDADGDGSGTIDAADFAFWRKNNGQTAGSISGTFDALNIVDTNGALAAAGATLQVVYASATLVQLKVVAVGSGASLAAAVPEPGTTALIGLALPALLYRRGRQSS